MKTRKAAIVIGIASMVAGCGGGAHTSTARVTTPVPPANVVNLAVSFFDHADSVQRALGHAYACTVAPPGQADAILYLGSATLVGKARAIVAGSPFPNTRVQVGWARRASYMLLPIFRALKRASLRYYPAPSRVDFETAFQSNLPQDSDLAGAYNERQCANSALGAGRDAPLRD